MGFNRFTMFPVQNQDAWSRFKQHVGGFWTPEEINLTQDVKDWVRLTDNERHFVKNVLAFFAASDGVVAENLALRFYADFPVAEVRAFYSAQLFFEQIHSETYSLLIDTYIRDPAERDRLFDALQHVPCVRRKAEWAQRWIASDQPLPVRLLAFACVEGIHFSGSFCAIFWLKSRGLMPGLGFSNELISRDEGLHTDFAVAMYTGLCDGTLRGMEGAFERTPQADVHAIVGDAVVIEKEFILESLPCSLLGMNSGLMAEYLEFVADRLLAQLGYERLYGRTECPFDFMESMSIERKTNFFEARVSEYRKPVGGLAPPAAGGEDYHDF